MRAATDKELENREFDLIVIGGGITGAATARDAALRGLSVLLVEKDDFAAGTSSRSSKLIHGGLRYLQTFQFGLVAESLQERERMLRIAPHLTRIRPFLYLLYRGYPEGPVLLNLGLTFYDAASGSWFKRRHSMLNARKVLEREPHLAAEGLRGAGLFFDVQTDDARLTLQTVKGAAEAGARVLNHAAVTGLITENGKCRGVVITRQFSGESISVRAKGVLNATGPWSDSIRRLGAASIPNSLRPTKGVHIVVRKSDFPLGTAIYLRSPDDNRLVWPIPSLEDDVVYIGTTDTDFMGDPDEVIPTQEDVRYLLRAANCAIPTARLTESHVVGSWAGLRPLVAPNAGLSTSATPREHSIAVDENGMLSITGGKLTSNRAMAKHLVDTAVSSLGLAKVARSTTKKVRLPGADGDAVAGILTEARAAGVPEKIRQSWVRRYGSEASAVLEYWRADAHNREIVGARELTLAELIYLVEHEMVQSLTDLLVRRTSAFFWEVNGGLDGIERIADELASRVPWSPVRRQQEIDGYRALVEQHRPGSH